MNIDSFEIEMVLTYESLRLKDPPLSPPFVLLANRPRASSQAAYSVAKKQIEEAKKKLS